MRGWHQNRVPALDEIIVTRGRDVIASRPLPRRSATTGAHGIGCCTTSATAGSANGHPPRVVRTVAPSPPVGGLFRRPPDTRPRLCQHRHLSRRSKRMTDQSYIAPEPPPVVHTTSVAAGSTGPARPPSNRSGLAGLAAHAGRVTSAALVGAGAVAALTSCHKAVRILTQVRAVVSVVRVRRRRPPGGGSRETGPGSGARDVRRQPHPGRPCDSTVHTAQDDWPASGRIPRPRASAEGTPQPGRSSPWATPRAGATWGIGSGRRRPSSSAPGAGTPPGRIGRRCGPSCSPNRTDVPRHRGGGSGLGATPYRWTDPGGTGARR